MATTRKAPEVNTKTSVAKPANSAQFEQTVSNALTEVINHLDAENKKVASVIQFKKAIEINITKDKPFVVLYVSYRSNRVLLTPLYKKLVT